MIYWKWKKKSGNIESIERNLNVVFKAIYHGSGLKVIGEFIPSTRSYTYNKLFIPNFDLQKVNFDFLLQENVATPLWSTGQKTSLK